MVLREYLIIFPAEDVQHCIFTSFTLSRSFVFFLISFYLFFSFLRDVLQVGFYKLD